VHGCSRSVDAYLPAGREEAHDGSTIPSRRDTMLTQGVASRGLPLIQFRRRIAPQSRARFC
jgi:hypothetical protein